jgi:hypothetical protein
MEMNKMQSYVVVDKMFISYSIKFYHAISLQFLQQYHQINRSKILGREEESASICGREKESPLELPEPFAVNWLVDPYFKPTADIATQFRGLVHIYIYIYTRKNARALHRKRKLIN